MHLSLLGRFSWFYPTQSDTAEAFKGAGLGEVHSPMRWIAKGMHNPTDRDEMLHLRLPPSYLDLGGRCHRLQVQGAKPAAATVKTVYSLGSKKFNENVETKTFNLKFESSQIFGVTFDFELWEAEGRKRKQGIHPPVRSRGRCRDLQWLSLFYCRVYPACSHSPIKTKKGYLSPSPAKQSVEI